MNDLTNVYCKLIEVLDSEESKSNATDNNETCLRETEEIFRSLNWRISQLQSKQYGANSMKNASLFTRSAQAGVGAPANPENRHTTQVLPLEKRRC